MGQMLIRKLDDEVIARLKARAKANNRSAEAEARTILAEALRETAPPGRRLSDFAGRLASGRSQAEINAQLRRLRDEWER